MVANGLSENCSQPSTMTQHQASCEKCQWFKSCVRSGFSNVTLPSVPSLKVRPAANGFRYMIVMAKRSFTSNSTRKIARPAPAVPAVWNFTLFRSPSRLRRLLVKMSHIGTTLEKMSLFNLILMFGDASFLI
jgi:hypothetical protein